MSRLDELNKVLRSLQMASSEIEACALISEDGLMIASALPQHMEELRIAGMSATILSLGSRASEELDRGKLEQVVIKGDEGYAVMVNVTSGSMLLVLANKLAKLGLLFLDMHNASLQLKKVLSAKRSR